MAKIKMTAIVADMRNKLNGSVFSRNRGGAYIRTKVTPINPQTAAQVQARSLLTSLSQGFRSLSQAQIYCKTLQNRQEELKSEGY